MLRTGQLLRPASHPASRPRTGASLPGTLASPRTGLSPAGSPQLVAWLRHDNLLVVMAPKLLDALPQHRTGVSRFLTTAGCSYHLHRERPSVASPPKPQAACKGIGWGPTSHTPGSNRGLRIRVVRNSNAASLAWSTFQRDVATHQVQSASI